GPQLRPAGQAHAADRRRPAQSVPAQGGRSAQRDRAEQPAVGCGQHQRGDPGHRRPAPEDPARRSAAAEPGRVAGRQQADLAADGGRGKLRPGGDRRPAGARPGRRADPVQCRIRHAAGGGSGADPHPGRADGGQAPAGRTRPHHRRRPQQVLGRAPRPGRRLWRLQLLRLWRPGPTHPQEAITPVGAAEAAKGEKGTSLRSPTAHIPETALALQRAPGERFRLRERPLPDGLVHVLEIASGSPQALAAAAAETGHAEQELLDAVRFYLEQVLFAAEDADAYRVLGLARDAPQDTIRVHHRWLQRWLHPDRAQAGDATVFATRVNQAWAQLRTPALRHDYAVRLAEARLASGDAPLPADTVHRWEQVDAPAASHGGRSRWLLAAALAACAVLAV